MVERWYPDFWNVPSSWRVVSWAALFVLGIASEGGSGETVVVLLALPFLPIPISDVVVALRQAYVEWLYERNRF